MKKGKAVLRYRTAQLDFSYVVREDEPGEWQDGVYPSQDAYADMLMRLFLALDMPRPDAVLADVVFRLNEGKPERPADGRTPEDTDAAENNFRLAAEDLLRAWAESDEDIRGRFSGDPGDDAGV